MQPDKGKKGHCIFVGVLIAPSNFVFCNVHIDVRSTSCVTSLGNINNINSTIVQFYLYKCIRIISLHCNYIGQLIYFKKQSPFNEFEYKST